MLTLRTGLSPESAGAAGGGGGGWQLGTLAPGARLGYRSGAHIGGPDKWQGRGGEVLTEVCDAAQVNADHPPPAHAPFLKLL
jgi:hypothetical protein